MRNKWKTRKKILTMNLNFFVKNMGVKSWHGATLWLHFLLPLFTREIFFFDSIRASGNIVVNLTTKTAKSFISPISFLFLANFACDVFNFQLWWTMNKISITYYSINSYGHFTHLSYIVFMYQHPFAHSDFLVEITRCQISLKNSKQVFVWKKPLIYDDK